MDRRGTWAEVSGSLVDQGATLTIPGGTGKFECLQSRPPDGGPRYPSRGISSVGRASGWQPEGHRFEPVILHFIIMK